MVTRKKSQKKLLEEEEYLISMKEDGTIMESLEYRVKKVKKMLFNIYANNYIFRKLMVKKRTKKSI